MLLQCLSQQQLEHRVSSEKMALRKAWADTLPFLWTLRQLAIFWVFLLSPWGMLPI